MDKIEKEMERMQFGWMFHCRNIVEISQPGYLIAVHHSVWHCPSGQLVDITPIHDEPKHQPIMFDDKVLFLVDDKAIPIVIKNFIAPLQSHFYSLSNDERVILHVKTLIRNEEERHKEICAHLSM